MLGWTLVVNAPIWSARDVVARLTVTATAYNADDGHEWCPKNGRCGSIVYAGGPPWEGTVAVSDSLLPTLPMGTHVRIRGFEYIVRDRMAHSIKGDHIDIYCASLRVARNFGIQRVEIEVLSK